MPQPKKARTPAVATPPRAPAAPSAQPRVAAGPRVTGSIGGRTPAQPAKPAVVGANTKINSQTGQAYTVQQAQGGVWHTYPGGRRVFVKAGGAKPPAAPATPSAASAASAAAAQPDAGTGDAEATFIPDATYESDVTGQTFARNQRIGELAAEDTNDDTNYREALRRFREQLPRQRRAALEQANAQGLAQSSRLREQETDIEVGAARQETDMSGAFEGRKAAREAARQALLAGATVEEAAARAAAIERQTARIAERADEGSLVLNGSQTPEQAAQGGPTVAGQTPAQRLAARNAAQMGPQAQGYIGPGGSNLTPAQAKELISSGAAKILTPQARAQVYQAAGRKPPAASKPTTKRRPKR